MELTHLTILKEISLQSRMLLILKKEVQTRVCVLADEHIFSILEAYLITRNLRCNYSFDW